MRNTSMAIIVFISLVSNSLVVASAQQTNIWGIEKGDSFQWITFDNYYTITSYENNESLILSRSHIDSSMKYRIIYDYVKNWKEGDLSLNVSSSDISITTIQINVTYFTIGGKAIVSRNYTDYRGESISTIIPSQINVFSYNLYIEPYYLDTGKNVKLSLDGDAFIKDENGNLFVPGSLAYATTGIVNVTFYNYTFSEKYRYSYFFSYVFSSHDIEKNPVKYYESLGMSIEVIDVKDYDMDSDTFDDLLIMTENTFSAETPLGDYTIGIPRYFDTSSLMSLLYLLSFIFTSGSISIPFGFSLPSGMSIMYSDAGMILASIVELSPTFVNDIIAPLLSYTSPNIDHFMNSIHEQGITLSTLYNSLLLLSMTNFLILPSTINMTAMGQSFMDFSKALTNAVPIYEDFDLSGIIYSLDHAFNYTYDGENTTIVINSESLPLIYDSKNGMASIEIKLIWKHNIFYKIEFTVNYVTTDFGHTMGFKLKEIDENDSDDFWANKLTDFFLLLIGLFTGGTMAMVITKKRNHSPPFKSAIEGMRDEKDCFNGFCPDL